MAPIINGRVLFNAMPEGFPEPGKATTYDVSQTIDLGADSCSSIDPYMRNHMKPASPMGGYILPFVLGELLSGHGVSMVICLEHEKVKVGEHLYGLLTHKHYMLKQDLKQLHILENPSNLPWSTFLGVLGMAGQTAYFGWREYSHAKKNEVIYVTTGAVSVGLVIQLAKINGLKVIASAGSEEKLGFMKEIGAEVVFNYKTTKVSNILVKEGPIDLFWDNVGGGAFEAAIEAASLNCHFIECSKISGYNGETQAQPKNLYLIKEKSISISGFVITQLLEKYKEEFYRILYPLVASGQIKHREAIYEGLEQVSDAILGVQKGTNKGKATVCVADA
ncbi:alcohol dehydrogenase [Crucibulum laeve]|uniref:Alcohol dehydrogenase n=1 Tax=Crucibulum laeve TaxID=68775 RepID=A0A5C3LQG7_9AGAR|nr:alcohol dehydrogenase [Crucibulum laeve]